MGHSHVAHATHCALLTLPHSACLHSLHSSRLDRTSRWGGVGWGEGVSRAGMGEGRCMRCTHPLTHSPTHPPSLPPSTHPPTHPPHPTHTPRWSEWGGVGGGCKPSEMARGTVGGMWRSPNHSPTTTHSLTHPPLYQSTHSIHHPLAHPHAHSLDRPVTHLVSFSWPLSKLVCERWCCASE